MKSEICCNNPNNKPLNKQFWEEKYTENQTGWDIGYPSPPLIEYMRQVENKNIKILIPGAGNAYEVKALLTLGFKNITVVDIAKQPIKKLQEKFNPYTSVQFIEEDFFLHKGSYDIMLEQTFFCALPPNLRLNYVQKTHELLLKDGKLVGVLFNRTFKNNPPYGGNTIEYKSLFRGLFNIYTMETCYNSIPERKDSEVFIIMKKNNP